MHERERWGTGDPESSVGGTVETKKRGRGNVVSPGPFSWPAPAARRVIASPRQASRVRPLLHTISLAPLPFSYLLLFSPFLSAMPGARSGSSVLDRAPLLLSSRSWITTRFLPPRCTPRAAPPAQSASSPLLQPARITRATVHLPYAFFFISVFRNFYCKLKLIICDWSLLVVLLVILRDSNRIRKNVHFYFYNGGRGKEYNPI